MRQKIAQSQHKSCAIDLPQFNSVVVLSTAGSCNLLRDATAGRHFSGGRGVNRGCGCWGCTCRVQQLSSQSLEPMQSVLSRLSSTKEGVRSAVCKAVAVSSERRDISLAAVAGCCRCFGTVCVKTLVQDECTALCVGSKYRSHVRHTARTLSLGPIGLQHVMS